MKAMKRYIVFLPVFVWAIFFAGAEVKVENASIHRSGDSIRVSFKILVPSGTIASDYVQRLIPVIENGVDSLALDENKSYAAGKPCFRGKRMKFLFIRPSMAASCNTIACCLMKNGWVEPLSISACYVSARGVVRSNLCRASSFVPM